LNKSKNGPIRVGQTVNRFPYGDGRVLRVVVQNESNAANVIREALYEHAEIEVIDDPLGQTHEAVPFETILVSGPDLTASTLRVNLDRFFRSVTHRRMSFEVHQLSNSGEVVAVFGDFFEPGWGKPRGALRVARVADPVKSTFSDDWVKADWWAEAGNAVFALSNGFASTGLPVIDLRMDNRCLLVRTMAGQAVAQVRELHKPVLGKVKNCLGRVLCETPLTSMNGSAVFSGALASERLKIEVTPDTSFSRLRPEKWVETDCLEIIGLYLPKRTTGNRVLGLKVNFNASNQLGGHRLLPHAFSVNLLRDGGDWVHWQKGDRAKIGPARTIASIEGKARSIDKTTFFLRNRFDKDEVPANVNLLCGERAAAMGWIPLKLDENDNPGWVQESHVAYQRTTRVSPDDDSKEGSSIYLDWLNTAALVLTEDDTEGGSKMLGLADYLFSQGLLPCGRFIFRDGHLRYQKNATTTTLKDKSVFLMGPLRVRYHVVDNDGAHGLP